jgi:hypothetical protein
LSRGVHPGCRVRWGPHGRGPELLVRMVGRERRRRSEGPGGHQGCPGAQCVRPESGAGEPWTVRVRPDGRPRPTAGSGPTGMARPHTRVCAPCMSVTSPAMVGLPGPCTAADRPFGSAPENAIRTGQGRVTSPSAAAPPRSARTPCPGVQVDYPRPRVAGTVPHRTRRADRCDHAPVGGSPPSSRADGGQRSRGDRDVTIIQYRT